MCVCLLPSHLLKLVDAHQPGSHRKFTQDFLHLPSAVLALIFIARRIQPSLSPIGHKVVEFNVPTNSSFYTCWAFFFLFFFFWEEKSQFMWLRRDSNSRPNVRRFRGYRRNHRGDRSLQRQFISPLPSPPRKERYMIFCTVLCMNTRIRTWNLLHSISI